MQQKSLPENAGKKERDAGSAPEKHQNSTESQGWLTSFRAGKTETRERQLGDVRSTHLPSSRFVTVVFVAKKIRYIFLSSHLPWRLIKSQA